MARYNLNESSTVDNLTAHRTFTKISHHSWSSIAALLLSVARQTIFNTATQQKYAVEVTPTTEGMYLLDIRHQENN